MDDILKNIRDLQSLCRSRINYCVETMENYELESRMLKDSIDDHTKIIDSLEVTINKLGAISV